jgi:hypothetical protein
MLSRNTVDLMWRSDYTCRWCDGRGYFGKPSLRRRIFEWLSAPESLSDSNQEGVRP